MPYKDPAKKLENAKKRYSEKREDILSYGKGWRQTVAGKYSAYRDGAVKRNLPFEISLEDFKLFWQVPCYYCGDAIDTIGLDRINSDLGYTLDNLRPCCTFCNRAKLDNIDSYFEDKILKIAERIKRRRCL